MADAVLGVRKRAEEPRGDAERYPKKRWAARAPPQGKRSIRANGDDKDFSNQFTLKKASESRKQP
eukprot:scaffold1446_cov391-Prasinococcus_capsulatus_cf.AAC.12